MVEKVDFIPLPPFIASQYSRIQYASFMGLAPEINRAWITVDNVLYLWNYQNPNEYEVFDKCDDVIIAANIVLPKQGIFNENVKYVLVLATTLEITLLAVCVNGANSNIKLIPTLYKLPSDNISILKITSSSNGRVFMTAIDNNVYELLYHYDDSFLNNLILGGVPQHTIKRVKYNVTNYWKISNILPPFVKLLSGGGAGGAEEGADNLADIVLDDVRNVLYTVTSRGSLSAIFLAGNHSHISGSGHDSNAPDSSAANHSDLAARSVVFLREFDLFRETQQYLSQHSFNNNFYNNSVSVNSIVNSGNTSVVSLQVVSLAESRKLQLLVVLSNGLRLYLSLLHPGTSFHTSFNVNASVDSCPSGVEVAYIRFPPSSQVVGLARPSAGRSNNVNGNANSSLNDGFSAELPLNSGGAGLKVSAAYVSHGVSLLATEAAQQKDELLALYDDYADHHNTLTGSPANTSSTATASNANSFFYNQEAVSLVLDSVGSSGKIYDIKEAGAGPDLTDRLTSLFFQSRTPASIGERSAHHQTNIPVPGRSIPIQLASNGANQNNRTSCAGYEFGNLDKLAGFSELTLQQLVSAGQRRFLVLTNQGLHVLAKRRPADVLYKLITTIGQTQAQTQGFNDDQVRAVAGQLFSPLHACVMCLGLAVQLPGDASSSAHAADSALHLPLESLQLRAMAVLFSLAAPAGYKLLNNNIANALANSSSAVQDSRIASNNLAGAGLSGLLTGNNLDYVHSTAHDAVYTLLGRILRPVWLRPVIVAPIGRSGQPQVNEMFVGQHGQLLQALRKPLLLLKGLLEKFFAGAVLADPGQSRPTLPLPSHSAHQGSLRGFGSDLVTSRDRDLALSMHGVAANISAGQLDRLLAYQAKSHDEHSLHLAYLLLARAAQLLNVVEMLVTVLHDWMLLGEPAAAGHGYSSSDVADNVHLQNVLALLGELAGQTFQQLVTSSKSHEAIKRLLNEVVAALLSQDKVQQADRAVQFFSGHCYCFFAARDKFLFDAFKQLEAVGRQFQLLRQADHLQSNVRALQELQAMAALTVELLTQCSAQLDSVEDIIGDSSSTNTNTSAAGESTLRSICVKLLNITNTNNNSNSINTGLSVRDVNNPVHELARCAVVDICLSLADKFQSRLSGMGGSGESTALVVSSHGQGHGQGQGQQLYHGGSAASLTPGDCQRCLEHCFLTLLQQVFFLKSHCTGSLGAGYTSNNNNTSSDDSSSSDYQVIRGVVQQMLLRGLRRCPHELFHRMVYSRLLQEDPEMLLDLDLRPDNHSSSSAFNGNGSGGLESGYLEAFLRATHPAFLYKYYVHQQLFDKAAYLMRVLALEEVDLSTQTRIEYLRNSLASADRAILLHSSSANAAMQTQSSAGGVYVVAPTQSFLMEQRQASADWLRLLEVQELVHQQLSQDFARYNYSSSNSAAYSEQERRLLDAMQQHVAVLNSRVLDVSALFNDICLHYKLFDACLLLVLVSATGNGSGESGGAGDLEQAQMVERLWRSIIYRVVPDNAADEGVRDFLRRKRDPSLVETDRRGQQSDLSFEQSDQWLGTLRHTVQHLLQQLQRAGAGHASVSGVVPMQLLVEELEDILACARTVSGASSEIIDSVVARDFTLHCICGAGDSASVGHTAISSVSALSMGMSSSAALLEEGVLLEQYLALQERWSNERASDFQVSLLYSLTAVLSSFLHTAIRLDSRREAAARQYVEVVRSGLFRTWLERLRRHTSVLMARKVHPLSQQRLKTITSDVHELQRLVAELLVATA